MLKRLIYQLGSKWRNPSLSGHLKFLNESDSWPLEKLQDYQFKNCKKLVLFAYQHSPFYKEYFDMHSFDPNNFNKIEDLNKLPPIRKTTLISNAKSIQSKYRFKKTFYSKTSGTSGNTLNFYKDESWDSFNRAILYRGWNWYGIRPWDSKGYLSGYSIGKVSLFKLKLLDFLQNRIRLYNYEEKDILHFVKKIKNTEYLHGYSSMIYEVAKKIEALGFEGEFKFKAIFGTAERIFENYQGVVKRVFGQKIASEYGSAETGIIAMECPMGNMHITIENCIVDTVGNEIIVTNLMSGAFPIIRYYLGDEIVLAPKNFECACGREHPVIKQVSGRVGFKLIGNTTDYPNSAFSYMIRSFEKEHKVLLNFQVVQKKKGILLIRLEQHLGDLEYKFRNELAAVYGDEFIFKIAFNCELYNMKGKFKDYISTLDQ